MIHLIGQLIFGLIVGALAKAIMPGKDPGGFLVTALIGLIGAFIGSFIGQAMWGGPNYAAGWVTAVLGALILLSGYRLFTGRSLNA